MVGSDDADDKFRPFLISARASRHLVLCTMEKSVVSLPPVVTTSPSERSLVRRVCAREGCECCVCVGGCVCAREGWD